MQAAHADEDAEIIEELTPGCLLRCLVLARLLAGTTLCRVRARVRREPALRSWRRQSVGGSSISVGAARGIVVTGEYVARTEFEAGNADIRLSLRREGGNWRILSFRLDSDQF